MTHALWLLKSLGAPGSIPFLVAATLVGLGLRVAWPRRRRLARTWLAAVFGLYGLLSVPAVATTIASHLPAVPAQPALDRRALDALIVFDGDNRRGRVQQSKELFDLTHPSRVWLLGNPWMLDALWRSGVRYDDIRLDPTTYNTRAQIAWVVRFFASHPGARAALVASRLQMPRVAALVADANVRVVLVPSPVDVEPPTTGWARWVPSYYALRLSRDALYEHAAIRDHRWQGWTEEARSQKPEARSQKPEARSQK